MKQEMEKRLTEMVFADPKTLVDWLTKMTTQGKVEANQTSFTVTNDYLGITGGTNFNTDPIGKAVIIAYCILGPLWPAIVPGLLECVKAEWKLQSKKAKKGGTTNGPT